MVTPIPMLTDSRNMRLWTTLDAIVSGDKFSFRSPENQFNFVLDEIINLENHDRTLMKKAVDTAQLRFPANLENVISKLESICGPNDDYLLYHMANVALDSHLIRTATRLLSKLESVTNRGMHEYILGVLNYENGDAESAYNHFFQVYLTEPTMYKIYPYLDRLSEGFGWKYVEAIEKIIAGDEPDLPDDYSSKGRIQDLLSMCIQWNKGNVVESLSAISSSWHFANDDPLYHSVYARLNMENNHYHSATESFQKALVEYKNSEVLTIGLSSSYRAVGDYEYASTLCFNARSNNPSSPSVLREYILCLVGLGRKRDVDDMMHELLLQCDARDHEFCFNILMKKGYKLDAIAMVRRVHSRCPEKWFALKLDAEMDLMNGNAADALDKITRALKLNKFNQESICIKARALAELGRGDKALNEMDVILYHNPDNLEFMKAKRDILISMSRFGEALSISDKIIEINKSDAEAYIKRGEILESLEKYDDALESYRSSLSIREDSVVFVNILRKLLEQRHVNELCELVDDYDSEYGNDPVVWRLRGNAEYLDKKYPQAVESYRKATSLVPTDAQTWHSKGLAEENAGNFAAAEACFDRAIIIDLNNHSYWISKAVVQKKQNDISGAIHSINKVISDSPENVFALVLKARLLVRVERYEDALYFLDMALKVTPKDVRIRNMKKQIYQHQERHKDVIEMCRQILLVKPKDARIILEQAYAYAKSDVDDGINMARVLVDHVKDSEDDPVVIQYLTMKVLDATGDIDEAIEKAMNLLKINPNHIGARNYLHDIYLSKGMIDEAKYYEYHEKSKEEFDEELNIIEEEAFSSISIEDVLNAAYKSGRSWDDSGLHEELGLTESFINNMEEILKQNCSLDEIDVGYPELEELSRKVIIGGNFENISEIPIEATFVFSGLETVYDALLLQKYIKNAINAKEFPDEIKDMIVGLSAFDTLYETMVETGVGIYSARALMFSTISNDSYLF